MPAEPSDEVKTRIIRITNTKADLMRPAYLLFSMFHISVLPFNRLYP